MALPPPPKYKRFVEKNDSKHVERQRAQRAARRAEIERLMREREREEFHRRLREDAQRRASGPTTTTDPFNNVVFYTNY